MIRVPAPPATRSCRGVWQLRHRHSRRLPIADDETRWTVRSCRPRRRPLCEAMLTPPQLATGSLLAMSAAMGLASSGAPVAASYASRKPLRSTVVHDAVRDAQPGCPSAHRRRSATPTAAGRPPAAATTDSRQARSGRRRCCHRSPSTRRFRDGRRRADDLLPLALHRRRVDRVVPTRLLPITDDEVTVRRPPQVRRRAEVEVELRARADALRVVRRRVAGQVLATAAPYRPACRSRPRLCTTRRSCRTSGSSGRGRS